MAEDLTAGELKPMTLVQACKAFFGLKSAATMDETRAVPTGKEQTLVEFAMELRKLTPEDKTDLVEMFRSVGIDATKNA